MGNEAIVIRNPIDLLEMRNKTYDTFDEYKANHNNVLTVKFCKSKGRWMKEFICSCHIFQRNFMCKHLLGLALYNKLKKWPEEGINKTIAKKKSKGRIALAKKALQKQ